MKHILQYLLLCTEMVHPEAYTAFIYFPVYIGSCLKHILKYILTLSAPFFAFLPGQNTVKRGKHVKDRPGDYEIVIQHHNSRHDNHAIA